MEAKNREKGFLSRLFTSDPKAKPEQYRVQVKQSGEASEVNVLSKDGATDSSSTARRILSLLLEQLK
jgi:outer membrane protein assembly factor BamC